MVSSGYLDFVQSLVEDYYEAMTIMENLIENSNLKVPIRAEYSIHILIDRIPIVLDVPQISSRRVFSF